MKAAEIVAAIASYPDLQNLAAETYEPKGIYNSEIATIIALSRVFGVDLLIESGRSRGHSTAMLAKYLPDIEIHSFDFERGAAAEYAERALAPFGNLTLHYGDTTSLLPSFVKARSDRRTAILIDGPKGRSALDLLADCIVASPSVVLGFNHDMSLPRERAQRDYAQELFESVAFTDDLAVVEATRHLDRGVFQVKGESFMYTVDGGRPIDSYGPTLGCFQFSEQDRIRARRRGRFRRLKRSFRESLSALRG